MFFVSREAYTLVMLYFYLLSYHLKHLVFFHLKWTICWPTEPACLLLIRRVLTELLTLIGRWKLLRGILSRYLKVPLSKKGTGFSLAVNQVIISLGNHLILEVETEQKNLSKFAVDIATTCCLVPSILAVPSNCLSKGSSYKNNCVFNTVTFLVKFLAWEVVLWGPEE